MEYQAWGRLKIKAGLQALQLPEKNIREALDTIDETKYFDNLHRLIEQYRPASSDKTNGDKLLRFLLQRGFTYEDVRLVIQKKDMAADE